MKTGSIGSARSAGRVTADTRTQGGRTEHRRNVQGIGTSTEYGRLITPAVSSPNATLETLDAVVAAIGIVWLFAPNNPLLLDYGFP